MCTLSSLTVGFSVLLQLNVVLFHLNLIVCKYKRQIILSLLRRRLKLCSSAFEALSGHGLTDIHVEKEIR